MALTAGVVRGMRWQGATVSVSVGPSPSTATVLTISFGAADSAQQLAFKRAAVNVLIRAQLAAYPVALTHPDGAADITGVDIGVFDISPVGLAIHGDFYTVTGSAIPADAELVFETTAIEVRITPDLARPHWVFVTELPSEVPVGRNLVRLETPAGWRSDSVPVDVFAGPATVVRVLYPGAPKDSPYAIVLAANGGILTETAQFIPDPLLTNRPGFHDTVGFCMRSLLTGAEDCLRQGDWDAHMRFVALFDASLLPHDALVEEVAPDSMRTRKFHVAPFLTSYGPSADVAFVIHGSTTHPYAWTWATIDDPAQAGTGYTYDGVGRTHGHYPQTPGSGALWVNMDRRGITPLHECVHAMGDLNNGRIVDLYVDVTAPPFFVNKKLRAQSAAPVPAAFATYNGANILSDPARDGLGYGATWRSYHPALLDPTRPNVMDDYWRTFDDPQRCRLDMLTYAWLTDRLRAKLTR